MAEALTPLAQVLAYEASSFNNRISILREEAERIKRNKELRNEADIKLQMEKDLLDYRYGLETEQQKEVAKVGGEYDIQQEAIKGSVELQKEQAKQIETRRKELQQQLFNKYADASKFAGVVPLVEAIENPNGGIEWVVSMGANASPQDMFLYDDAVQILDTYQQNAEIYNTWEAETQWLPEQTITKDGVTYIGRDKAQTIKTAIRNNDTKILSAITAGTITFGNRSDKSSTVAERRSQKQQDAEVTLNATKNNIEKYLTDGVFITKLANDAGIDLTKNYTISELERLLTDYSTENPTTDAKTGNPVFDDNGVIVAEDQEIYQLLRNLKGYIQTSNAYGGEATGSEFNTARFKLTDGRLDITKSPLINKNSLLPQN